MNSSKKSVRWTIVSLLALVLVAISASVIFGPLAVRPHGDTPKAKDAVTAGSKLTLQSFVEEGHFSFSDDNFKQRILPLLPYKSISLERTACFGPCPVYIATFYRDGRATLVTRNWQDKVKKHYTAKIWIGDYIRLTQMVELARKAADKSEYAGQWTDDYTAIISAKSDGQTWSVSDYGRVAPVEVWALESLLDAYKSQIDWTSASGP